MRCSGRDVPAVGVALHDYASPDDETGSAHDAMSSLHAGEGAHCLGPGLDGFGWLCADAQLALGPALHPASACLGYSIQ